MAKAAGAPSRDSPRAMPERSITSITPIHRHSTPIMDRHSSTPAAAPSKAPFATAGPFPRASPHSTAAPTISVQIHDIAIPAPPCPPIYTGPPWWICPNSAPKFVNHPLSSGHFDSLPKKNLNSP